MALDGLSVKQGKKEEELQPVRNQAGSSNKQCSTGAVGTVIGAVVPLSPVVAFVIVIAAAGPARRVGIVSTTC